MIINDLDVFGFVVNPSETDTQLIVDANATLPRSTTLQFLKAVAWRSEQVLEGLGVIQVDQFATNCALDILGQLC